MKENITDEFIEETISKDLLKRNRKLANTINIILKQKENFIMSINGEWGCGKTVFAKQIEYLLNNNELYTSVCSKNKTIPDDKIKEQEVYYYNAWENDSINMPVQSLIFQLIKHFNMKYEDKLNLKEVGKSVLDVLVNIGSMGIVSMDPIFNKNYNHIDYNQMMTHVSNIEDLKKCLNNVIDQILSENKNRLIIIIDELDRCRPTYAIEMLECIKHFYNNDKLSFLVVTNNAQLAKTVKKVYGQDYNGDLYLNRFYDVVINLNYNTTAKIGYASLIFNRKLNETDIFNEIIMTCIHFFNMELRQINSFCTYVKTAERALGLDNDEFLPYGECEKYISFYFCCITYALNISKTDELKSYTSGKWDNLDEFINYNIKLLKWFEEYEFFRDRLSKDKTNLQLLKDIYICIFGNLTPSEIDQDLKNIYYSPMKSNILSTLELQF